MHPGDQLQRQNTTVVSKATQAQQAPSQVRGPGSPLASPEAPASTRAQASTGLNGSRGEMRYHQEAVAFHLTVMSVQMQACFTLKARVREARLLTLLHQCNTPERVASKRAGNPRKGTGGRQPFQIQVSR